MADPIIILGCGAAKRDLGPGEQVAIVDLYTGPLYRARLAYARALGGPQWILSGLHGLRRTDYLVGTYEHDLRKARAQERDGWALRVACDVQRLIGHGAPIVALASGPYLVWIRRLQAGARSWGRPPWSISVPAEGLPLGEQRRWLALETARLEAERAPSVPDGGDERCGFAWQEPEARR